MERDDKISGKCILAPSPGKRLTTERFSTELTSISTVSGVRFTRHEINLGTLAGPGAFR